MIGPSRLYGTSMDETYEVTLNSFFMGTYPVTQKAYIEIMGTNPSDFDFRSETMQIDKVSWFDAIEFCNRLSQRDGLTPAYTVNGKDVTWNRDASGYRLPTEAEWEYAARAVTAGRPFGSDGSHPWGLEKMPGDIWEWCWDIYGSYPTEAQTNPAGSVSGKNRVMRAGTYAMCEPRGVIVRLRSQSDPSYGGDFIGFRMVRPAV